MLQIRHLTFETNSSSSHSLVVTKGKSHYTLQEIRDELDLREDGTYRVWSSDDTYFGRYPFRVLHTFTDKLNYAYACSPLREQNTRFSRRFYTVTDIVRQHIPEFNGFDVNARRYHWGTDDCLLPQWLKTLKIDLWEFLTNKHIVVVCDGDEYCIWEDMKEIGLIDSDNISNELY